MSGKHIRFSELLELHVNNVIKKKFQPLAGKQGIDLTPDVMREVRDVVRATVGGIFAKSSHKINDDAVIWLSNKFFMALQINGEQTMADLVVVNENKLSTLPYHDVELLRNLFNETGLAEELEEEYRTRSQS